jgi:hypothetical protein
MRLAWVTLFFIRIQVYINKKEFKPMNRMKRFLLSLSLIAGTTGLLFAQQAITGESRGIKVSFTVQKDTVEITMSAPVKGWVAIGIDPTDKMKDADFKIAYVKDGMVYIRDDYGNNPTGHTEDVKLGGTSDILSYSGKEENGVTTITFVVPRQTADSKDKALTPGTHKIIVAASDSDSFSAKHKTVGSFNVTLP